MKYNTTYEQKINLKDTLTILDDFRETLISSFKKRYKMLRLISPSFLEEWDERRVMTTDSRPISFDFGNDNNTGAMILDHSNWLREKVIDIDTSVNEGFYIEVNNIARDKFQTPTDSINNNNMIFAIRIADDANIEEAIRKELSIVTELINKKISSLMEKYPFLNTLPDHISTIDCQTMENEYPSLSFNEREDEFVNELKAFYMKNPGVKLYSGHRHKEIASETYHQQHIYQLLLMDYVNSNAINVCSVSQLATGTILNDQLSIFGKNSFKEFDYYAKIIKSDYNILEVKIDIGKLIMVMLEKGHISEVIPSVISNEAKTISTRYKINKY
ncbi:MAG: hypothetical protein KAG91_02230 [Mycoplasmataceae bacterium]|nr:hypothetical protein [Mycoplasmataceae bacterium]